MDLMVLEASITEVMIEAERRELSTLRQLAIPLIVAPLKTAFFMRSFFPADLPLQLSVLTISDVN